MLLYRYSQPGYTGKTINRICELVGNIVAIILIKANILLRLVELEFIGKFYLLYGGGWVCSNLQVIEIDI